MRKTSSWTGWWFLLWIGLTSAEPGANTRSYTKKELDRLRDEVSAMFHHAYDGYLKHAYPYDELRPLTCDGVDTWGSYSLTLIDALDTLAIMGNFSEFRRVHDLLAAKKDFFNADINVSVFETNIRIIGGLLSAHLLSPRAGVRVEPGWPCNGPLLRMAEDAAKRLLPAFDTFTGMPYGTVNLRHGVPRGETSVTCTAGVGTFILEFGSLSRLTGNPIYEETAARALRALWHSRSSIGLVGNHLDVQTGKWTAKDAGVGGSVDSYYEYLAKGATLLDRPELMQMFIEIRKAVEMHMNHDDWYMWVNMNDGQVTMPVFNALEAFWPGVLSLVGDHVSGMKSLHNYHQVWKRYGFTPEVYNVVHGATVKHREWYPLRPELVESTMHLYQATRDPFFLGVGEDVLRSIEYSARTECGYATVRDVHSHVLENRMESFFLAETTKYLYLLFHTDNFIHNPGNVGRILRFPHGGECIIDAGGYVFNTEAHPIDPGALKCCTANIQDEVRNYVSENFLQIMLDPSYFTAKSFQGDNLKTDVQTEAVSSPKLEKPKLEEEVQVRQEEEVKEDFDEQSELPDQDVVVLNSLIQPYFDVVISNKKQDTDSLEIIDADEEELMTPQSEGSSKIKNEISKKQNASQILLSTFKTFLIDMLASSNLANDKLEGVEDDSFDEEKFLSKVMSDKKTRYQLDEVWYKDHTIMSCTARKFLDSILTQGEFTSLG